MSKVLRVIVGLVVLIVLLLGAGFFLASRYLTEERVKALLVPPLEEATGLRVSIGEIKRRGLAGVRVVNVAFADPLESQPVLSTKEVRLSLRLMPLLHGRLTVTELVFVEPTVSLVREKDGRLNLVRYFAPQETAPQGARKEEGAGAQKFALVFQNLRVERARISFRDERGEVPPLSATLSLAARFSLAGGELALEGRGKLGLDVRERPLLSGLGFRVRIGKEGVRVEVDESPLLGGRLSGEAQARGDDVRGRLTLSGLDLGQAAEWAAVLAPQALPGKGLPPVGGRLDLDASFSLGKAGLEALKARGKLDLALAGKPVAAGLAVSGALGRETGLRIEGGRLLGGELRGQVKLEGQGRLRGSVTLSGADFALTREVVLALKPYLLPEEELTLPPLSGRYDLRASVRGPVKDPVLDLVFRPRPLETSLEGYRLRLEGRVRLAEQRAVPDLLAAVNGQEIRLKGTVDLSGRRPRADLALSAGELDLEALVPAEGSQGKEGGAPPDRPADEAPLAIPLEGRVRVKVARLCYRLCGEDLRAEIRLSPDQVRLRGLRVRLAGGEVKARGGVEGLLGTAPRGSLSYAVSSLKLPTLVGALAPGGAFLTRGSLASQGSFAWQGLTGEAVRRTLSGEGGLRVRDLGLRESTLTRAFAALLNMEELTRPEFRQGEARFQVRNGLVNVKGALEREGLRVVLSGALGLDGRLRLKPQIHLSGALAQSFARRFPGASLFRQDGGYLIPLTLEGTIQAPRLSLVDIKEKVKERALQELFKLLGPSR